MLNLDQIRFVNEPKTGLSLNLARFDTNFYQVHPVQFIFNLAFYTLVWCDQITIDVWCDFRVLFFFFFFSQVLVLIFKLVSPIVNFLIVIIKHSSFEWLHYIEVMQAVMELGSRGVMRPR